MSLPTPPNINKGQLALDPVNGIVYYIDDNNNLVKTTWSWLRKDLSEIETDDNVTITGNLVVEGSTVTVDAETVVLKDNFILVNATDGQATASTAGIEVERGSQTNVQIRWNESTDKWQFTNDGTTFYDISSIIANSVELGTHTTGDYVENLSAGTGVTISSGTGEGSNPTISIGQDVSTSATPTFGRVIAPLTGNVTGNVTGNLTGNVTGNITGNVTGNVTGNITGNVTGNLTGNVTGNLTGNVTGQVSDISNHTISDLSDINIVDPISGDFLRYNGSDWINDPVNLTTDTVGDYVAKLAAGTGITITNNSGEGATPNIAFSGSIDDISDIQITSAANGETLIYNGTNWVNTTFPSMEPIGFEDAEQSNILFNNSTRQFSISPVSSSFTVWCVGKRYIKNSTETIEIPNTSNLYYIYYNTSGSLSYKTTFFTLSEDTPIAYVYWNQTDGTSYFVADERHGVTLDWATHEYLHRTRGAAIANGFGANNYTTSGNGSSDSHAQIDIANGTFFDEDLRITITHSATPAAYSHQQVLQGGGEFPVFYRTNSHYRRDSATKFPMKIGSSRVTYNLYSGGLWSTPDIDNNKFGITYLVATNDLNDPIFAIMGQAQYTDQGSAEAASWNDMNMDDFPIAEFRILYKLIYQTSSIYGNTPKARLTGVQDLRVSFISGGNLATVPVSDHGTMTGLSDDDHTQYLLADGTRTATSLTVSGAVTASSLILDGIEIDAATPSDTNVLKYDAGLNKYVPGVASTVASLDDLTDVVITSATPNQVIKYDGTNWVNAVSPSSVEGTTHFATIGNGVDSSFVVNHNLSTRDVVVSITEALSPYGLIITSWEATDLNNITIYFDSPPSNNSVRIAVYAAVSGAALTSSLDELSDVAIAAPSSGEFLKWDGSNWINAPVPPVSSIDDIDNVSAATPSNNEVLAWNSTISQWIAKTFTATVSTLDDIGDVTITSATPNHFLKWNGSAWVNDVIDLGTDTSGFVDESLLAAGPARAGFRSTINAQTGTTYSLVLSDLAKLITMDNAGSMTLTVPTDASQPFTVGDRIDILRKGSGSLTIQGAAGVTVNGTPGLLLRAQWSSATLIKLGTNSWVLIGDLQA